jgi:predicted permease
MAEEARVSVFRRILRVFRRDTDDRAVADELRHHLDLETVELIRGGLNPDEARRRARLTFGDLETVKARSREIRRLPSLEAWLREARHGIRALGRTPGFAVTVLMVLGVGIGAVTAIFVLLNAVILRPLPFPDAQRLVSIDHAAPGLGLEHAGLSSGLYFHYTEHARSFEAIGHYREDIASIRLPDGSSERAERVHGSASLFQALGARPILGRLFTEEDGRPGFMDTRWPIPVLLSYDFWVERLNADRTIIGRPLTIDGRARLVVGVLDRSSAFPRSSVRIWMLQEAPRASASFASRFAYKAVARLRPGVTPAAAEAELAQLIPRIEGAFRDATPERIAEVRLAPRVVFLKTTLTGDIAPVLWTLFGGMIFLLAIACANGASLFRIRAEHRRREVAVRRALGAQTGDVKRLFFLEALALTSSAAALGIVFAESLVRAVLAFVPVTLPRSVEIALDGSAVVFAGAIAVVIACLYGVVTIRVQGRPLTSDLTSSGFWSTTSRVTRWIREPLVAVQVALALALLMGSALMVQTYQNLSARPLGFEPEGLLAVDVSLLGQKASSHVQLYQDVVERIRQLPGVVSASAASFMPLTPSEHLYPIEAGATPVLFKFFLPGYFQTMQTPVLEGAKFAPDDVVTESSSVLVSPALARRLSPDGNALGNTVRRLNQDGSDVRLARSGLVPPFRIVGVAGDVRETALRDEPAEVVYVPVIDPPVERSIVPVDMTMVVRTDLLPLSLAASVRSVVEQVDPAFTVGPIRTVDEIVSQARARETFVGLLLLLAAGMSLFLGVTGIYGSVAHVVRSRTREIGIRLALGAERSQVVRMVAAGSMRTVLAGVVAGLMLALAASQALAVLLFGISAGDVRTLLAVTVLLVIAAAAAAWLAASRAARVSPTLALRGD